MDVVDKSRQADAERSRHLSKLRQLFARYLANQTNLLVDDFKTSSESPVKQPDLWATYFMRAGFDSISITMLAASYLALPHFIELKKDESDSSPFLLPVIYLTTALAATRLAKHSMTHFAKRHGIVLSVV